ncbi:MAG: HEAT repeat domain-containing protein [Thermomicrobiales bacterium]
MLQILESASSFEKVYACGEIGDLGERGAFAIETLVKMLEEHGPPCSAAAKCLGELRVTDPAIIRRLAERMSQNQGSDISFKSADALGHIGPPAASALPELEAIAKHSDSSLLRECAQSAIEKIRDDK